MTGNLRKTTPYLATIEFGAVVGLVCLSLITDRFLPWTVVVIFIFLLIRWLALGQVSRRTPADLSILALVLMLPVTLGITILPTVTRTQVLRLLVGIGLFYATVNWVISRSRLHLLATGMVLVGLFLALSAPFMVDFSVAWPLGKLPVVPPSSYETFFLVAKDSVHPNVLAGNISILWPIPLALLVFNWKGQNRRLNGLYILALLCMAIVLFLTQSRGAWLACGSALLLLAILRWRWGWLLLLPAIGGIGLIVYLQGPAIFLNRLSSGANIEGLPGRLEIWTRAIYMIRDFPFTGIGMGSYGSIADLLYPFYLAQSGKILHAHNLFLQIGVDLGLPGLIAWLSILFTVVFCAWKLYRSSSNDWSRGLGVGLLGSQLALIVHGMTDSVTWGMVKPAVIVWAIWGLTLVGWQFYSKDQAEWSE